MLAQHARRTRLQDVRLRCAAGRGRRQPARPARHRHREDLLGRVPPRGRHLAHHRHLAVRQGHRPGHLGSRQGPSGRRRRTTTWRSTCAPSGPPRSSARSRRPSVAVTSAAVTACPARPRGEPARGGHGLPAASQDAPRQTRDPIRAGRDALLASLDRPLGQNPGRGLDPAAAADSRRPVAGGAAALLGGGPGSAFDDDADLPKEVPAVPSLAVLRPRRTVGQGGQGNQSARRTRRRRQAAQAPAELGRRPVRRRPGRPRVLLTQCVSRLHDGRVLDGPGARGGTGMSQARRSGGRWATDRSASPAACS